MEDSPLVVLVVGASNGIGRSSALRFAAQGAHLVVAARSADRLESVASECRDTGAASAVAVVADILDEPAVAALFERIDADYGRLDLVIHTPAVMAYGHVVDVPKDVFEHSVSTTIFGTANVARHTLARFEQQQRGTFIIVTSLLASVAVPEMGTYATGKWAQLAFARTLSLETRHMRNVHVATVAPGPVATPIYRRAANYAGRAGKPMPPTYSADRVAGIIERVARKPKPITQAGLFNVPTVMGFRFARPLFDALVSPLFHFAGMSKKKVEPTPGNVFAPDDIPFDART